MSKKIKCSIITLALASVVTLSAALSACTIKTDHPTAKITVSFNEVTYDIEYKLYRNMYPQTVQHFIELADEGFYNDMIVHDFKDGSEWFTGAYGYNEPDNIKVEGKEYDENVLEYTKAYENGALGEYLERNYNEEKYYELFSKNVLTPSVYTSLSYDKNKNDKQYLADENKLPTLIGEFSENKHDIENNALTAKFGALKMFYFDKGTSNQKAYVQDWHGDALLRDYKYNCATSVFSMQVGSSSYSASKYCVFAELKNDKANDVLESLIDAIDDYKTEVTSSKFITTDVETRVDMLDTFAVDGDIEVAFSMTSLPIIIKSVKITKY